MRLVATVILGLIVSVTASPPDIEYIYPAGAQRGTTVSVRVGGYYSVSYTHLTRQTILLV